MVVQYLSSIVGMLLIMVGFYFMHKGYLKWSLNRAIKKLDQKPAKELSNE